MILDYSVLLASDIGRLLLFCLFQKKPVVESSKHDPNESALLAYLKGKAGRQSDKKSSRKTRRERRQEKLTAKGGKPESEKEKKRKDKKEEAGSRRNIVTKGGKQTVATSGSVKTLSGLAPAASGASTAVAAAGVSSADSSRPKKSRSGKDKPAAHIGGITQDPEIKVL
jgi:hypothetical protein